MTQAAVLELSQQPRYSEFYTHARRAFSRLRFDVNYRKRRLHEVFRALGIQTEDQRVLDVGFGAGDLLLSFPSSCRVVGVDVSSSAIDAAREDERFARFAGAEFCLVPEHDTQALPALQADIVLSSHVLEHAPDDRALLLALLERLRPGGVLGLFVPLEEPDYILFHRRNYSLQSITERVEQAGFELLHAEGNLFVNGHVWKCLTVPSRRNWPGVRHVVDALRMASLGALPYPWLRRADHLLFLLGASARQALVVARRRA
jgi:SAM-dependent methyltransferase